MKLKNNLLIDDIKWNAYQETTSLNTKETHVFAIPVHQHFPYAKKMMAEVLSDREQDKASRLFNPKDKERYVVSKYCLRKLLAIFLNIDAIEVEFSFQQYQKPATLGIEFNISHTEDYILLAISQRPIGVDVEYLNREFDFESILNISFSKKEIDFIGRPVVNTENFYSLWTRKEALLKAVGEGINDNLHHIDCLNEQLERNHQVFNMRTFLLSEDYMVSLAVQKDISKVQFWKWE